MNNQDLQIIELQNENAELLQLLNQLQIENAILNEMMKRLENK